MYRIPKTFLESEIPAALKLAQAAFLFWQKGALGMSVGGHLSSIPSPWVGDRTNQKPLL